MQYAWLIWSLSFLVIWFVVYILLGRDSRREMLVVSLWTSLAGLTEPLFVPQYWSPPSLFDLARTTGFDIESFIFAFAIGGLAAAIYELIFATNHKTIKELERGSPKHKYHLWVILSAPIMLALLILFTNLNPIYSAAIAMMSGGILTWFCRPDLKKKMMVGGILFLGFYFVYFLILLWLYPGYVDAVWNLPALSNILVFNIPIEELMFAFAFGFLWSSIYEHATWQRIK
ncbi:MAG: lycopene cyclase domain-containing protein [bacterium]|nr:lycopene cyclase domain-containing protein [bacterium]